MSIIKPSQPPTFQRNGLPIPNELLYSILLDLILENIHSRFVQESKGMIGWDSLSVLPCVCHLFQATCHKICANVLSSRKRDHKSAEEAYTRSAIKTARIAFDKILRFSESHLSCTPLDTIQGYFDDLSDMDIESPLHPVEIDANERAEVGLLDIYWLAGWSNILRNLALEPEPDHPNLASSLELVKSALIMLHHSRVAFEGRSFMEFTARVSDVVIEYCLVNCTTVVYCMAGDHISLLQFKDSLLASTMSIKLVDSCLDALKTYETNVLDVVPECLRDQCFPNGKFLCRTALEASEIVVVMKELLTKDDEDPYGIKLIVQTQLTEWGYHAQAEVADLPVSELETQDNGTFDNVDTDAELLA